MPSVRAVARIVGRPVRIAIGFEAFVDSSKGDEDSKADRTAKDAQQMIESFPVCQRRIALQLSE